MKDILDKVGVGGDRLEMFNMSSAMGKKWAEICTEVTARIKELGPSPARGKAVKMVEEVAEPGIAGVVDR